MVKKRKVKPAELIDYMKDWYDNLSYNKGLLIVGLDSLERLVDSIYFCIWRGYDNKFYCIMCGRGDFVNVFGIYVENFLKQRKTPEINKFDEVRLKNVVLDTSAIIAEVPIKLIDLGLLRKAIVIIPYVTELELHRLGELGKRKEKKLLEKSNRGLSVIAILKRYSDDKDS